MMYGFPEYVDKKIVDIYKNNVNQFLLDLYSQFKSRKIVIWGTGLYGRAVASLLIDNSFNVVGFCDSFFDESENKSIVLNGKQIQVHGCRFNFEHFQDAVYFISTDYYQDIIELIKKENITIEYFLDLNSQYIEKQLVYFGDYPKFDQLVGVTYNWFLLYKDFVNKGAFKSDYQTLVKLFSNDEMSIEIINKRLMTVYKFLEPIRYISLGGSKYCNLRCEHCFFIRDNEDIKDTDISKVINFLGILKSKGYLSEFKALRLANGEPSIIKDDIKLADYCIENSIPVEIYTNGAKVPQTFVDGVNKGLFRIILSPDAGSREVYKNIKGKDYFETTWFNIKKYVEQTRGNVEVKFILEKGNIDDVDNMINMCLKTGVNKVHLSMDVNISETEFYKYESSFSHFVNRCKNEGINLLSIFTFVPEQIKNKVSNLSTE